MSAGGPGRLPDFIVIGAMKAGSTTLWGLLTRHPDVFMCEPKEPQFFSRDERYARGLEYYASLFAGAAPHQVVGEASTCYSRWPHHGDVAGRIASALPNVKLLYQLRHPVDRAYSHYQHRMEERASRGEGRVIGFREALDGMPEILDASRYPQQLARFLEHFPRERICVFTLERLLAARAELWRELQAFLGVREIPLADELPRDNPAGTRVARGAMRGLLRELRAVPGWKRWKALIPSGVRGTLRSYLLRPDVARRLQSQRVQEHALALEPLDPALRRELIAQFEDTTREVERIVGHPLPEWRR